VPCAWKHNHDGYWRDTLTNSRSNTRHILMSWCMVTNLNKHTKQTLWCEKLRSDLWFQRFLAVTKTKSRSLSYTQHKTCVCYQRHVAAIQPEDAFFSQGCGSAKTEASSAAYFCTRGRPYYQSRLQTVHQTVSGTRGCITRTCGLLALTRRHFRSPTARPDLGRILHS
jgi:hypothetical protein